MHNLGQYCNSHAMIESSTLCTRFMTWRTLSQRKLIFRDITRNVADTTWYYAEYFMWYHVFHYISCYITEILITFRTGHPSSLNARTTLSYFQRPRVQLIMFSGRKAVKMLIMFFRTTMFCLSLPMCINYNLPYVINQINFNKLMY